jgi:hypothetical protein
MREVDDPTVELVGFRPRPVKITNTPPPQTPPAWPSSCCAAGGRAPECSCVVCPITISFASGLDQHCGDDATAHAVVKPARSFHRREPVFPHLSITPIHRAALSLLALQPPPDFPVLATPPNAGHLNIAQNLCPYFPSSSICGIASLGISWEVRCSVLTAWTSALILKFRDKASAASLSDGIKPSSRR